MIEYEDLASVDGFEVAKTIDNFHRMQTDIDSVFAAESYNRVLISALLFLSGKIEELEKKIEEQGA